MKVRRKGKQARLTPKLNINVSNGCPEKNFSGGSGLCHIDIRHFTAIWPLMWQRLTLTTVVELFNRSTFLFDIVSVYFTFEWFDMFICGLFWKKGKERGQKRQTKKKVKKKIEGMRAGRASLLFSVPSSVRRTF